MFAFRKTIPLTEKEERKAERNTILSACCTCLGDVPFTDAAIIILYANMLGANEMFSMITTSFMFLAIGIFTLIATMLAGRQSYQKTILQATVVSLIFFCIIAAAPWFGDCAVGILLISLAMFSFAHSIYIAAWFPLMSTFLSPQRRGFYLGKMRFCWQSCSAVFLFLVSLFIGNESPIYYFQIVMLISIVIFSFKLLFIASVPVFETVKAENAVKFSFRQGLRKALENKPLAGFSVYTFMLNVAAYGTIPLVTLYLKNALDAPDNVIVLISAVTLGGMLCGSLSTGKLLQKFGARVVLLTIHIVFAVVNFILFFLGKESFPPAVLYSVIALLLFIDSFMLACSDITSSSEMMKLATPGNSVVAMAFFNTFNYFGRGISRLLSSLILGTGALALQWSAGEMQITHYQTLFLVYSVGVVFCGALLVIVPAIFPHGEFRYQDAA